MTLQAKRRMQDWIIHSAAVGDIKIKRSDIKFESDLKIQKKKIKNKTKSETYGKNNRR